ncbi:hypothetical protein J2R76_003657 [Bradyrhizobium sp. USDA 4532]|uniref:hypothetical protein n=1 Tax=unclassified Bradyrhizobium TaxID=2631580 RepID=UPI00209D8CE4|nr:MULTISPECIES: hypothetical protein [unclassified Bradyrhizobium]MCP1835320.1 hypothetical protein [Bradyrhizobium sp. USDA 4545]MCP1920066.1 hypothetical protein [Bradyrhizobium sp. USDA 4532]
MVPAEQRSQLLNEPLQFDPDPFADDAAGPIDPDAFIFAPLPLSPGELSRLLDNEPTPPQPNQLADEPAGAVDTGASVIFRPPRSQDELGRLLDDAPAPGRVDQFTGQSPNLAAGSYSIDFENVPFSPGERRSAGGWMMTPRRLV